MKHGDLFYQWWDKWHDVFAVILLIVIMLAVFYLVWRKKKSK